MARWQERVLGCYDSLGRNDEALALRRTLAEQLPWDTGKQIDYARHLLQTSNPQAAYDWLQKQLDRPVERDNSDDESLRSAYADLYRTQVRWPDLLEFTTSWVRRNPQYAGAYQQHLSALIYNDRLDDANTLAETWLKESQIEGKLAPDQRARFDAAVGFAHGNTYNINFYRMDERWYEPLAAAARYFVEHKHFDLAQAILNDGRVWESDTGDRLRGYFLNQLTTALDKLSVEQISSYINWAINGRLALAEPIDGRKQLNASEVPDATWQKIADELHKRWAATEDKDDKNTLSESLRTIYATRFAEKQLLPFLRERIATAPKQYKHSYIAALFDTLLSQKWTEEIETEAFQRLRDLSSSDEPTAQLVVEVPALYRLVDAMLASRISAGQRELHDQGHVDDLTRTELAKKNAEITTAARTGLSKRLSDEAAKETGSLAPWLRMEEAWLDVQLSQNLAEVEEQCWKILGEVPPKPEKAAEADIYDKTLEELVAQAQQRFFDALLRQRAFTTAMNLAARRMPSRPRSNA